MCVDPILSIWTRFLLAIAPHQENSAWRWKWDRWWNRLTIRGGYARISLHGTSAIINAGNSYPYYARIFPDWNEPLLQCLRMVAKKSRANLIDVGAAIGDTILMLQANAPSQLGAILAVEGDHGFAECLRHNTKHIKECFVVESVLSSTDGANIASLERHHPGSATASGKEQTSSCSLDSIVMSSGFSKIHLLKIDVDGFDGEVLAGALGILTRSKPAVIFEWHPPLCRQAGNDPSRAFEVLSSQGYDTFLWFDKFGHFQQVDHGWSQDSLITREQLCGRKDAPDVHWDVIALPTGSNLDWPGLACGRFKIHRASRW